MTEMRGGDSEKEVEASCDSDDSELSDNDGDCTDENSSDNDSDGKEMAG